MAFPKMSQPGPTLSAGELEAFENLLGHRLPVDYRQFLFRWNGGTPTPDAFTFGDETSLLGAFYSIGARQPLLDLATRRGALRGIVPPELLVIARDLASNLICIRLAADRFGSVCYVPLDRAARAAARSPLPLAETFASFVASLFAMGCPASALAPVTPFGR